MEVVSTLSVHTETRTWEFCQFFNDDAVRGATDFHQVKPRHVESLLIRQDTVADAPLCTDLCKRGQQGCGQVEPHVSLSDSSFSTSLWFQSTALVKIVHLSVVRDTL